ncbi:MAG TPA: PilZ domain-containing protein [Anaeromyxobacteraceae bacterium]|nr:PilZ domain-containing protein [Anaeromyxobacteraceae bacterium]
MSPSGAPVASRVLVVGQDADVSIALHLHLERAGFAVYCLAAPGEMEPILRQVAPHVIVLMLPAAPDASWGNALTAAQGAARVGVRVVLVAPSRDVVEPLAAVAGADRAMARAEVLSRPMSVMERAGPQVAVASPPVQAGRAASTPTAPPPVPPTATLQDPARPPPPPNPRQPVDLMALIDEELVDEPQKRAAPTRVEVNVSLVSEHNFYVGPTRRIDSGGVFIATMMPPPVGTRLQVRLGLADGRKIDLEGEVAFVRAKSATTGRQPSGCGVRLFNLPGWSVDAVEKFFLARHPILYVPT